LLACGESSSYPSTSLCWLSGLLFGRSPVTFINPCLSLCLHCWVSPLLGVTATAFAAHYVFSVNIFGRMQKSPSPSGRLFALLCAIGLYSSVVAAIFFATSFLLLWTLQIPRTAVLTIDVVELALFSVVGYIGFARMKRNIQWLSATGSDVVGD